jgi:two-component system phosphate regulon sensor histidine kinase PhoR
LQAARLYERTRAARLQAEAAIQLRDEVLAGVSHDLAGPLARIRLYAELIQTEATSVEPASTAEQLGQWSQRIVGATSMMKSIIQELIDVAHLQMGQALHLNCAETDLVTLVRRAVADHQPAGRRVLLEASVPRLVGWWDAPRLGRVIANLLDNAVKYSPEGSEITVGVETAVEQETLESAVLTVADRGIGIPEHELPHIFERFYRGTNVADSTTGSGLGLAVARQIVEHHAGHMAVQHRPGGGTVVQVCLPLEGPTPAAPVAAGDLS